LKFLERSRRVWAGLVLSIGLGVLLMAATQPARTTQAATGITVNVAYADNLRQSNGSFPSPWAGAANVTFEGCSTAQCGAPGVVCSVTPNCGYDTGAVQVVNTMATTQSIDFVKIDYDSTSPALTCEYDIWPHGVSLAPGASLIVAQKAIVAQPGCNAPGTSGADGASVDGSDIGPTGTICSETPGGTGGPSHPDCYSGNCSPNTLKATVEVSVGGVNNKFTDANQILNSGGYDVGTCGKPNSGNGNFCASNGGNPPSCNESTPWTPVGTVTPTAPHLTVVKSDNVNHSGTIGSPWTWAIVVGNNGTGPATFPSASTILKDNLPSTNITYGSPTNPATDAAGTTGTATCAISANVLTCTASGGAVVIPVGGTLTVSFTATASAAGTYVNPPSGTGNVCEADPANVTGGGSPTCSDTVTVPGPAAGKILPTGTTCAQFSSGSYTLQNPFPLNYTVSSAGNFNSNINPGVFFYFTKITPTGNTIYLNQAITNGPFDQDGTSNAFTSLFGPAQLIVYSASCSTVSTNNSPTADSNSAIQVSSLTAGTTYIVSVKYSAKLTGLVPECNSTFSTTKSATVDYQFTTTTASGGGTTLDQNSNGLALTPPAGKSCN
jgi:hypothetical protein